MEPARTPLDINQIMGLLPHRYPFLLIDRVDEIRVGADPGTRQGRTYRCVKNVTFNEPFFTGHFPNLPVMPGVLIIEAMAQSAAIACYNQGSEPPDFFLAAVRDAKFRRKVIPGDQLIIEGVITRARSNMIASSIVCRVDGEVAAEAEVMARIYEK